MKEIEERGIKEICEICSMAGLAPHTQQLKVGNLQYTQGSCTPSYCISGTTCSYPMLAPHAGTTCSQHLHMLHPHITHSHHVLTAQPRSA